MEEIISATSVNGTSWDAQLAENSDMDIVLSRGNIDEIMPTFTDYTNITSTVDVNNTMFPNQQHTENQLRALVETFTGADAVLDTHGTLPTQTEETNQMMNAFEASWLSFEQSTHTNEESNRQQDLDNTIPSAEATRVADTVTDPNIVQAIQQSWLAQVNRNQFATSILLPNQLVLVNHIMPVIDPFWFLKTVNTNQPELSQAEPINSTMPTPDPSWVGLGMQPVVNTNQVGLQWEGVPLVYPEQGTSNQIEANEITTSTENDSDNINQVEPKWGEVPLVYPDQGTSNQLEANDTNMLTVDNSENTSQVELPWGEVPMIYPDQDTTNQIQVNDTSMPTVENSENTSQVNLQWEVPLIYPDQGTSNQLNANDTNMPTLDESEANWEVHPFMKAALASLNDGQISGQQPMECTINNPSSLAMVEEVQPLDQAENTTIAIPLITDPNATPELITFRPGIYEGDAIPPSYSNFSIIATPSDYEPRLPSPIYPELTIIPESIPQYQMVGETINPDVDITVNQSHLEEPLNSDVAVFEDEEESRQAVKDVVEQKLPTATSLLSTLTQSGYRGVDAKLLSTLRQMKLILIYKGFHYSRYYSLGKKICWRCVSRKCQNCEAFLYSVGNKITMTHPYHNHLTVISQKPINKETNPNIALSFENANSDITDPDSSLIEAENAADRDNIVLSHDDCSQRIAKEDFDRSDVLRSVTDPDSFDGNRVFTSGNTIISHGSDLEITVKSPFPRKETNEDLAGSVTDTILSHPDPLDICVTSYRPEDNEASSSRNCFCKDGIPTNIKRMTVPKDIKVKITISTKPRTSKPRIYYDGKLAPQCTMGKKSTSRSSTVPSSSQEAKFSTVDMTNATYLFPPALPGIPIDSENTRNSNFISDANVPKTPVNINFPTLYVASSSTHTLPTTYTFTNTTSSTSSVTSNIATGKPPISLSLPHIPTDSDPEESLPLNIVSRTQTQTPEQHVFSELPSIQGNVPLAVSTSISSFSRGSLSPTTVSTTTIISAVQRPGLNSSIRAPSLPMISRSGIRRTMIPTGYTHQRYRLARARDVQPKNTKH